jgi:hypothetical protein
MITNVSMLMAQLRSFLVRIPHTFILSLALHLGIPTKLSVPAQVVFLRPPLPNHSRCLRSRP